MYFDSFLVVKWLFSFGGHSISSFILYLQVSIEYGLCEMLNREAIRADSAPKDGNFGFSISELQALLPDGTVDTSVTRVYEEVNILLSFSLLQN